MAKPPILWAINPFQQNPKLFNRLKSLVQTLMHSGMSVEPAFVVSPAEANVALEFNVAAKGRFKTVATREIQRVLKSCQLRGLKAPQVLVESRISLNASVKRLSDYAVAQKASAIVAGTHAHEGLRRILLGSFAESLLASSRVPLLLVNPSAKPTRELRRLLFATDFSPASLRAFRNFCDVAAWLKAGISLLHVLPTPFPWVTRASKYLWGDRAASVGEYLQLLQEIRRDEAKDFVSVAKRLRLPMDLAIEPSTEDVGKAILEQAAKLKVDAIALVAQTGRWQTALLGSVSRAVIREAEVPVWVQRI
jgi:Universal stress protein UspA and related nucleotide-binding proteins